jgi:hypothetical protein
VTNLTANDNYILNTLESNWVYGSPPTHAPVLQLYPSFTNLPTVQYWEIGNEMDAMVNGGATNVKFFNVTNFTPGNYITNYMGITAAMLAVNSNILVGPGFANGFLAEPDFNNNTIIQAFLENANVNYDFIVYHPYPGNLDPYWNSGNILALETNLNDIWSWQDQGRNAMYADLAAFQGNLSVPLLATEWNGDDSTTNAGFAASMWTLLADTETVLSMARGQQTLDANYYPDTGPLNDSCWPQVFQRFQSNLGNYYVSSSYGNNVGAQYLPPGSTNRLFGSDASPFRVYSTLNSNSSGVVTESVWMLNFSNSASQTVDLHFPGPISTGTNYTLVCTNTTNSLTFQGAYGSGDIYWSNSVISSTNGAAMVVTIPPATLMVAQVTYSSAPPVASVPVITAMPSQGQPGQVVTITGNNFSPNAQQNTVYFGPVRGTVVSASASSLTVQVPYGAAYAPVTVTVSNLTTYSTNYFNPAYFGASVNNPIVMQQASSYFLTNSLSLPMAGLNDMGFADVNGDGKGDGKGDLAYVGQWSVISMLENGSVGPGSFALDANMPYSVEAVSDPSALAFGDLDGDGMLDWVWVDFGANTVDVLRNVSSPTNILFGGGNYNVYPTASEPYGVKVMDVDGDGRPDLVVINYGSNTVSVFRNLSSGPGNLTFAPKVDFVACESPRAVVVADFNGDGKPDIAVVGFTSTGSNLVILTNMCTPGVITFSSPIAVTNVNLGQLESIAVGDFNGDGKLDLAVGSYGNRAVLVYTNNGSGGITSFVPAGQLSQPVGDPRQIAIADLNGDGLPDVAVVSASGLTGNTVYLFGNTGSAVFDLTASYSTGSGSTPVCLLSGDFDGDGRPDLAVGNSATTNVVIFQNVSQY